MTKPSKSFSPAMSGSFNAPNRPTALTTTSTVRLLLWPARSVVQSQAQVSVFQTAERTRVSSCR
jgi:hypothetical protein